MRRESIGYDRKAEIEFLTKVKEKLRFLFIPAVRTGEPVKTGIKVLLGVLVSDDLGFCIELVELWSSVLTRFFVVIEN